MKRRHHFVLNLFAFALLAFALYLNFIRDESENVSLPQVNNKPLEEKAIINSVQGAEPVSQASTLLLK